MPDFDRVPLHRFRFAFNRATGRYVLYEQHYTPTGRRWFAVPQGPAVSGTAEDEAAGYPADD